MTAPNEIVVDGIAYIKKPMKKWSPRSGDWAFSFEGPLNITPKNQGVDFGVARTSRSKALTAYHQARAFLRLLAYRDEFAPDWSGSDELCEIYIRRNYDFQTVDINEIDQTTTLCSVLFPKAAALELVEKIKSGEVEL